MWFLDTQQEIKTVEEQSYVVANSELSGWFLITFPPIKAKKISETYRVG